MSDSSSVSTPFTQLIQDFKGKKLPSEQIEFDYNNTLNYANNYFVAPKSWSESFYTSSRKNMLLLSRGIENIVLIKPPFNKFTLISLFQRNSNFNAVKEQYITIAPLTKKLYLIGNKDLAADVSLPNTIDINGSNLEKNWIIVGLAEDEGCALIAEEFKSGIYRGFFTNNRNLVIRCLNTLNDSLPESNKIDI
jgi:Sensory domain in DIguanylate Cyclases and Two-component system